MANVELITSELSGEIWEILGRVLHSDTPLLKTQFFDVTRRSSNLEGEVSLWLSVLAMAMEDWLMYNTRPISPADRRKIRDLELWPYSKSFKKVAAAIDLAFKIDHDIFVLRFVEWLQKNKADIDLSNKFELTEPLESITETKEIIGETIMSTVIIREGVAKPIKAKTFPFATIKEGGALFAKPENDETLKEVTTKVRNATSAFKKAHPEYDLEVHVLSDTSEVMVYRNPTVAKEENNETETPSN